MSIAIVKMVGINVAQAGVVEQFSFLATHRVNDHIAAKLMRYNSKLHSLF